MTRSIRVTNQVIASRLTAIGITMKSPARKYFRRACRNRAGGGGGCMHEFYKKASTCDGEPARLHLAFDAFGRPSLYARRSLPRGVRAADVDREADRPAHHDHGRPQ